MIPSVRRIAWAAIPALALLAGAAGAEPYQIADTEGFAVEMTAATIDLPAGWQGKGRVAWNKPCSGNEFYELVFSASSPDGLSGMRIMPGHLVSWNDVAVDGVEPFFANLSVAQAEALRNDQRTQFRNSNCHVGRVSGTAQLIDVLILPKHPAGTKVAAIEPNEGLRATYAQTIGVPQQGMKTSYDAVIVHLTYPGTAGMVEERLYLSWYMFADDPATRIAGMPGFIYQTTFVDPISMVWAPADRAAAELPMVQAALLGLKPNAAWLAKVREVQNARNQQRQKDRAAADAAQQDANRARQEAFDRQNAAFLDTIRN